MIDGNSEIDAHEKSNLRYLMLKAFDQTDSSHRSDILYPKGPIFLHECATFTIQYKNHGVPTKNISYLHYDKINFRDQQHITFKRVCMNNDYTRVHT